MYDQDRAYNKRLDTLLIVNHISIEFVFHVGVVKLLRLSYLMIILTAGVALLLIVIE